MEVENHEGHEEHEEHEDLGAPVDVFVCGFSEALGTSNKVHASDLSLETMSASSGNWPVAIFE